ncbi:GNAT family N-acetyltransferase [Bacillus paramycoides]|uniref:GNAT family N-acetyltransferase n=1 Tax=Bacillus paramycoides TaxID=2026194 RepID=UPI002E1A1ECB|nr:GNAT family N-acetyltransferase [Bacillus paramycoides]MED1557563.1 GNAT family N-acetyltransferase [Bacillus paramycoides]
MKTILKYTIEPPKDFNGLLALYESLGWNSLKLTVNELEQMCIQSWYAIYVFDNKKLVGMGRVISDGVITGIICGVCVLPEYQYKGIGKEIVERLNRYCEQNRVNPQLMCVEDLKPYYESIGFEEFSIGMTKYIKR